MLFFLLIIYFCERVTHTIARRKSCLRCRLSDCGPVQSRDRCSPASSIPAELLHRCSSFTRQSVHIPTTFNFTRAQGPLDPLWLWIYGVWAWMHSMDRASHTHTHIQTHTHTILCKYCRPGPARAKLGGSMVLHFHSDICSFNCYLPSCPQVVSFGKPLC